MGESCANTSKKHKLFVCEPMEQKDVESLPGIDVVLGGRLREKGYVKAYIVLGRFLMLNRDQNQFMCWMHDMCGANMKQACDCYRCLCEWCSEHV
ncbi:Barrier-to-autointegration factor [Lamellibrachia satsuma]|nr:Barrier-to-autointegration factor [Lamellibrachia satsuma]